MAAFALLLREPSVISRSPDHTGHNTNPDARVQKKTDEQIEANVFVETKTLGKSLQPLI